MWVTKVSGKKEKFQKEKIRKTCLRAGANSKFAKEVAEKVSSYIYDGIPTREILRLTLRILEKERPVVALRYDLKKAILDLGPSGFGFEEFIARILSEYGYKTKMPPPLEGACISHEVDIVAEKDGRRYMIECKYRNEPGVYIGIKDVLYTWARFLDLCEGFKLKRCLRLDHPWFICNTKFSRDAIQFACCKRVKLTGWRYPQGRGVSLEKLIERKGIYPITVLKEIDKGVRQKLIKANIILCRDLLKKNIKELKKITGMDTQKLKVCKSLITQIIE